MTSPWVTKRQKGQAFAELCVGLVVVTASCWAAARLLRTEWNRARCAYRVFEAAHERLTGESRFGPRGVRISDLPGEVRASDVCGDAHEEVALRKLEPSGDTP